MAVNTDNYKLYNYNRSDMWNVPIDMRYESNGLINEFGVEMLYIRNCKYVKCKCYNDLHKAGDSKCPYCHGSGYMASIEKVKLIESSNGKPYMWNNFLKRLNIGSIDQKADVLYIQQFFNPKERDFVLKVTWDQKLNIPIDIIKVFNLIDIYEMRGDNGRTELYGCLTENRPDLIDPFYKTLRSIPQKAVQTLLKGGKFVWPTALIQN